MRRFWVVLPAAVVVLVVLLAYRSLVAATPVEIIHPRVQTLRAYVDEQAVTELPQDVLISMPIAGWLEPITLREGDPVKAGQVVAQLETHDLDDRVVQARQRIAVLETKLRETADNRLERNALVQADASVKALDEAVAAAEKKAEASAAVMDFAQSELNRLREMNTSEVSVREMNEAEMSWRKARADHQSDTLNLAAMKTIAAVSYIAPKFINDYIDRKSFQMETTQQQLEEAKAQLEIEKRNLERARIVSSIDGVVLERHQTRRQFLPAGTPLLTLGRLEELEIRAEVLTERATRLHAGDPVEIYGEALPGGPLPGAVLRIYPAGFKKISSLGVEQQRVNVSVRLDHRPPELGVAFRVQVRIYYDSVSEALTLPRTALFRAARGHWQVMIVENGRTQLRDVTVGLTNDEDAQIVNGLTQESVVISRPSRELASGERVNITPTEW